MRAWLGTVTVTQQQRFWLPLWLGLASGVVFLGRNVAALAGTLPPQSSLRPDLARLPPAMGPFGLCGQHQSYRLWLVNWAWLIVFG